MKRRALSPLGKRRVRIGRKAIFCSRVAALAEKSAPASTPIKKSRFTIPKFSKRTYILTGTALATIVVLSGAIAGVTAYQRHAAEQAELQRAEALRLESQKAAECLSAAPNNINGNMTFGEMYSKACE